jgi:dUTP pyrophosphatase
MQVQIKKVHADAIIPKYQTAGAAGVDLCSVEDVTIGEGDKALVATGLAIAIPQGWEGQVRPRSGLAAKSALTVLNTPGTIDSDYRGEVKVILINHGHGVFHVRKGDRIAQMVFAPVAQAEFTEVEVLDSTGRGAGGFGSTGK